MIERHSVGSNLEERIAFEGVGLEEAVLIFRINNILIDEPLDLIVHWEGCFDIIYGVIDEWINILHPLLSYALIR